MIIGPETIAQIVVIITAVFYSSRGVIKRLIRVENKLDELPCSDGNSGCRPRRPKIIVLKSKEGEHDHRKA